MADLRRGFCAACKWPVELLWSLYGGNYWGAEIDTDRLFFPAASCPAKPGPLGYGPHTPPS